MANIKSWINAVNSIEDISPEQMVCMNIKSTSDKYAEIRDLGLETVMWKSYSSDELISALPEIESFINRNSPCLFIYDPKTKDLKKGFLFGIEAHAPIYSWISQNIFDTEKYNYLITTQIENKGKGFVGSVFSDGRGKMWCETLHTDGVCNQRELSQPSKKWKNVTEVVNELYIDHDGGFHAWAIAGDHLTKKDILHLERLYLHRAGYFEFVKGVQAGKESIYTTGFEFGRLFTFPENIHQIGCMDSTYRAKGVALREGL